MSLAITLLLLFYVFFKVGLFTFGGGYAMIPLIEMETLSRGWITYDELINFIGISEMTPGPFAVNMATFVGTTQAGFLGALVATIGVTLPSFIIILLIAKFFHSFLEKKFVRAGLRGIQPVVVALIAAAGVTLFLKTGLSFLINPYEPIDLRNIVLLINFALLYFGYRYLNKKQLHPILLIVLGAIVGILTFMFF
jgi:chromate transporter